MERQVKIMGILNVTPDSFYDGGKYDRAGTVRLARQMVKDGAHIIDVGGESSAPGMTAVSLEEELRRTIPIIKIIKKVAPFISIDTYKAEVARQAIVAGAQMVNDVTALRGDLEMAKVIAESGVKVVLMYAKDSSARTTRIKKQYKDMIKTVREFLLERVAYAQKQGIKKEQIILDPGMGAFISGDPKYSFEVLRRLGELVKLGFPILIGASNKGFLPGAVNERTVPSFLAHMVAIKNGAHIIRTHSALLNHFGRKS